ncbi:MAG: hypothetical protein ABIB71_03185 [Candidatus Woesearchaeota archaeon]
MDCIRCKGNTSSKHSCGKKFCPLYRKAESMFKTIELKAKDFSGTSPSVFVGRYGYPRVNVGILSPPERSEEAWLHDSPSFWASGNFSIRQVAGLRGSLVNSRFKSEIKGSSRYLDMAKEIAMAKKPVDIDVILEKKPRFNLKIDNITMPMGPAAQLRKLTLASNPSVNKAVEKAVYDTDLKAVDAIEMLYDKGVQHNELSRLLSIGNFGVNRARKLVPTRWSITAAHDTVGKLLISRVKDLPKANYLCYFGGYLGNNYIIMLLPDVWSFELFESYIPGTLWNPDTELKTSTDHEFYEGRKSYAANTEGGYYACRYSVLEKLASIKRQASVIALRFITPEYNTPLGVWVCQEAAKKAMESKPEEFSSSGELFAYAKSLAMKNFSINIDQYTKKSKIINFLKTQSRLTSFF